MENYSVYIIIVASIMGAYFLGKREAWKEANRKLDGIDKELNKLKQSNSNNKIIYMQKEILFYISDGIHNFGDKILIGNENIDEKYIDNIRTFFAFSRWLSENLSKNLYSEEEYEKILKFIQKDFHDYFHHISKELDLQKFIKLVKA